MTVDVSGVASCAFSQIEAWTALAGAVSWAVARTLRRFAEVVEPTHQVTLEDAGNAPPTVVQKTLLGAVLKRGWADSVHDPGLVLIELDLLDQSPDDLAPRQPG